ncbi:hypothetical protein DRN67_03665, partial [Candidatus Micrarchaeota archaeon]
LAYLAEHPRDYANALRKLPRGLTLLFVHALQAQIFNEVLSERIKEGEITAGTASDEVGNLIGYESRLTEREREVLERHSLKPEYFKMPSMPELSSGGANRKVLVELKNFEFVQQEGKGIFRFELGAGSYATIALREFVDSKN